MEFQHGTWGVDETFGLLRDHGAVLCATDLDKIDQPPFVRVTEPFLYLRLRRTAYDEADLDAWAARISPFIDVGLDTYAFFRHDEAGISPGRAIALAARMGSAGADVAGQDAASESLGRREHHEDLESLHDVMEPVGTPAAT